MINQTNHCDKRKLTATTPHPLMEHTNFTSLFVSYYMIKYSIYQLTYSPKETSMSKLDPSDIEQLKAAIVATNHTRSADALTSNVTKIATMLCVAGILWIAKGVSEMKEDLAVSREWRNSVTKQMNGFNEFMKAPRFTREDFINGSSLLELKTQLIEAELKDLSRDLRVIQATVDDAHK